MEDKDFLPPYLFPLPHGGFLLEADEKKWRENCKEMCLHLTILAKGFSEGQWVPAYLRWENRKTWVETICGPVSKNVPLKIGFKSLWRVFAIQAGGCLEENGYKHVEMDERKEPVPPPLPEKKRKVKK